MQSEHRVQIFINHKAFELSEPEQSGASLKNLAGIPLHDVLVLKRPGGEEVIGNETKITTQNGEHFHTEAHRIHIFINTNEFEVEHADQTGASLKQLAGIPLDAVLLRVQSGGDEVISNDTRIVVKSGEHFRSEAHRIHIFINKKEYEVEAPAQTGASLKQLAGIPLNDVLFLQRPGEDEVIPNDMKIVVKNGQHFHSQPPADYGLGTAVLEGTGLTNDRVQLHAEAGGWTFLVISNFELPAGFNPNRVEMLVKLPPGFPDAAPDMFWICPAVNAPNGNAPRSTSNERILGKNWQRFSWHLAAGAWKPGISDLRDFLRCIRSRFMRLN
ncbi:MAG: multiubiquitin domain-containing protein [Acidobacteriota bacterium]|nr:multiubiquitin domain-containing protein [Acidobacteriota bacterium]